MRGLLEPGQYRDTKTPVPFNWRTRPSVNAARAACPLSYGMVTGSPGSKPPYETALTMWPDPRSDMCGRKLVTVRTGPRRFVSSIQVQSWLEILSSFPWSSTPAALTRMSTRPIALMESRTSDLTDASLRTSVARAIADSEVPSFRTSSTVLSIRGTSKSATTTLAPCRASALAMALPTPLPPPVTTATLPPRAPRAVAVVSVEGVMPGEYYALPSRGSGAADSGRARPAPLGDRSQSNDRNLAVGAPLIGAVGGVLRHDPLPGLGAGITFQGLGLYAYETAADLFPNLVWVTSHVEVPGWMSGGASPGAGNQPTVTLAEGGEVNFALPPTLGTNSGQDQRGSPAAAVQPAVEERGESK